MSRTNWAVDILQSGGSWLADGNIFAPNENLSLNVRSTQVRLKLADGSNTWITPETVSNPEELRFTWQALNDTEATKLRDYVTNGDYLRLTDHNGIFYYGKFINIQRIWLTSLDPDTYDIQATFEQMSGSG